jgi:mono/diheme cytochrome c family protein
LAAQTAQRTKQIGRALELVSPTGGAVVALGFDAEQHHALHTTPNEITAAMSHYLLGVQRTDGSWASLIRRVPMTDGAVVGTAWAARAVQLYPPADRIRDAEDAVRRARQWLLKQQPPTLNERVFQLLGLAWTNETNDRMRPFAEALAKEQRPDGGWAQLPGLDADSWATGSALIALHKAGIATSHASYQRGVEFLLRTQFDDGSWWVRTRAWPFQPHFDAEFPHGRDQWISAAGTTWATMALLLTLEPTVAPASLPSGQELIAAFLKKQGGQDSRSREQPSAGSAPVAAMIDFARDIQPLFERSCVGCHGGTKPKAMFNLTTREGLIKGGQSGDPAIVPGHAEKSPLYQQVSDAVEDLEMPPLARRAKYPALTKDEIASLRTWIDAGAPWPQKSVEAGAH